jgi:hypothetical protein
MSYSKNWATADLSELVGQTLLSVETANGDGSYEGDALVTAVTDSGTKYRFVHYQDCCESVDLEDVCGELDDLIGSEILTAEEVSTHDEDDDRESFTWTFYKFSTRKGYVTLRFYGESNGYYSERVEFEKGVS